MLSGFYEGVTKMTRAEIQKFVTDTLTAAENLSGVNICLYDTCLNTIYKTGNHSCEFCRFVRNLPYGRQKCINCDHTETLELAQHESGPFVHTCHAGMTEIIVPVRYKDSITALIYCGQCRFRNYTELSRIEYSLRGFDYNREQLLEAYEKLPAADIKKVTDTALLLQNSFSLLMLDSADALNGYFDSRNISLEKRAMIYIGENFSFPNFRAADVAEHFSVSSAHLNRLYKRKFGQSISQTIIELRINKACELLKETDMPIVSIALNTGFYDQNYFSRTFSKRTNLSPSQYRSKFKS